MPISAFEWHGPNIPRVAFGHGIDPEAAEKAFALASLSRRTTPGADAPHSTPCPGLKLLLLCGVALAGLTNVGAGAPRCQ